MNKRQVNAAVKKLWNYFLEIYGKSDPNWSQEDWDIHEAKVIVCSNDFRKLWVEENIGKMNAESLRRMINIQGSQRPMKFHVFHTIARY